MEKQQYQQPRGYGSADMEMLYQTEAFDLLPTDETDFAYGVPPADGWSAWDPTVAADAASDAAYGGDDYAAAYEYWQGSLGEADPVTDTSDRPGQAQSDSTRDSSGNTSSSGTTSGCPAAAATTTTTASRPQPAYRFRHDLPVPADWDPLQPLLRELYMERRLSLRDVADIMQKEHQFIATERMYKHQFKKWNWHKYRPKEKKDRR